MSNAVTANGPTYNPKDVLSASEAARALGIEKVTLMDAIRRGRIMWGRDRKGRYTVTRQAVEDYRARRDQKNGGRKDLKEWAEGNPEQPKDVSDHQWYLVMRYCHNPNFSYEMLAAEERCSRQRIAQIINRVLMMAGMIRPDGTRGFPREDTP